jgi:retinoid hydroxylase
MGMVVEKIDPKRLPPGSFGLPIIGERPRILDIDYLMEQYKKHGPVFKTRILSFGNVAVFLGPEANRFLLSTGMHHFSWRNGWPVTFKSLLGESLFVQDGVEHRAKRKLLMPAFHRDALHNYLDTMEQITWRYLDKWHSTQEFSWLSEYKQFTFEIASILLTGSEPGAETADLSRYFALMTSGFITIPVSASWTPYGKALKARNALLNFIDRAIEHRRANPSKDALSLLVQTKDEEGNGLTNQELRAQMLLMLFAGHETSASMMTFLMMTLKQNPHVLAKARAEQDALNLGQRLTMDNIRQMSYLEQVLKEVERLYPPVPIGFRGVIETFEFNGYTIPKGWTALYPINVAHRDPGVYQNPDVFDPERFGSERNENNVPFSLVGFGGGARICLGYSFAQLEMKIMVSYLLRYYDWEIVANQDLKLVYRPTLFPKDGLKVRFWRR